MELGQRQHRLPSEKQGVVNGHSTQHHIKRAGPEPALRVSHREDLRLDEFEIIPNQESVIGDGDEIPVASAVAIHV